jgi:hypothetical protein
MPFEVTLFSELESEGATRTWKVVVADGYVNERLPGGTGDALIAHFPENIEDAGSRVPFTVEAGKQVSLIVEVDEDGEINPEGADDAVRVAIEDIDEASTHFEPKIGDASTGVAGVYHYKLATIEESDTPDLLKLKSYLAGSHISHFRELPLLKNLPDAATADTGRIVKEYDKDSNEYRFRSIAKGDGQLRVDEDGDNVTVRGNGKNLNLSIFQLSYDNDGAVYDPGGGSPTILYWRDGLYCGTIDPDDGTPPAELDEESVTYLINQA